MAPLEPGKLNQRDRAQSPSVSETDEAPSTGSQLFEVTQDQSEQERERARRKSASPPAVVEGYEIQGFLGAGAYGSVWKALQKSTGKRVAIKFYEHRGGLDWTFLSREVEKLAFLYTDRDVVQLIDVGWDASPPYYVMEYLERGSLDQLMLHGRVPVEESVRLVREVGQALVHAHGRGILHCDLKPANVLLDNDWKVRLADFGQSRLSHEQVPALGTLFYMAPEQADLKATPDARWDVYALGALLYHMLTGSPPHRRPEVESRLRETPKLAERLAEYQRVIESAPVPTDHRRLRGVDRSLAEIVERCLESDPARRFPNAQAVIEALDRRTRHRAQRPLMWLGGVVPVLLLLLIAVFGRLSWQRTVQESEESLVAAERQTNEFAASGAASSVLLQLAELRNYVLAAAGKLSSNDELIAFLRSHADRQLDNATLEVLRSGDHVTQTFLNAVNERHKARHHPFETWVIFNAKGTFLARSPVDKGLIGRDFHWRDYFQGLMQRRHEGDDSFVYISRVFRSKAAGNPFMFGMSTPVYDDKDGEFLGVLMATITTNSLPIDLARDVRRLTVLVGRWDENVAPDKSRKGSEAETTNSESDAAEPLPDYRIFVHPLYPPNPDEALDINDQQRTLIEQLSETDGKATHPAAAGLFVDPVAEEFEHDTSRWLPGLSKVGETPFIVFVQQRYEQAIKPAGDLAERLAWRGWQMLGLGVVLLGGAWYFVNRAMQRDDTQRFWADSTPADEGHSETETWNSLMPSGGASGKLGSQR